MIIDKTKVERIALPGDQWVDVRRLTWQQWESIRADKDPVAGTARLLNAAIAAWSDDVPVTPDAIDQLDAATAARITAEVIERSGPVKVG